VNTNPTTFSAPGSSDIQLPTREVLLDIFRRVITIRFCGDKLQWAIRNGRILAPLYPVRGHEIISSAMAVSLNRTDYMCTIYRGLADHIAKGVPLKELLAEYAGRMAGACKGKGGPMHITHPASGVVVTTGVVGSGIPIANGLAWASLVKKDGRVTVTTFGDGATNIGAFHEGLNLASLWTLPVVFLCTNNGYAEHTRFEACTAVDRIADRAAAYRMHGVRVDGTDVVAMWRVAKEAISRARSGGGPTLIEAMTVRVEGHVMGDACEYIPKEDIELIKRRDPVPLLRDWMLANGHASEAEIQSMEADATQQINEAMEFALNAPYPTADELARDVLAKEVTI
jgi:acetoin:2,6-dichlorophenolindophenol oxidoreductase subunit alpha